MKILIEKVIFLIKIVNIKNLSDIQNIEKVIVLPYNLKEDLVVILIKDVTEDEKNILENLMENDNFL